MTSTFLSYSRQQYYFAESVALHLQQRGISVWFDIQQLEPGVQWSADIEAGLQNSDSVTLLASRSALASPYVEKEWRHALEHGKPVFVLLIERVRLPRDLRDHAFIIDFRRDFVRSVDALVAQYRQPTRNPIAVQWLPYYPAGVARMATVLTLQVLQYVGIGVLYVIFIRVALSRGALPDLLLAQLPAVQLPPVALDFSSRAGELLLMLLLLLVIMVLPITRRTAQIIYLLTHNFDYQTLVTAATTAPSTSATPPAKLYSVLSSKPKSRTRRLGTGKVWLDLLLLWLLPAVGYGLVNFTSLPWRSPVEFDFTFVGLIGLLLAIGVVVVVDHGLPRLIPKHPHPDLIRWAKPGAVPPEWRQEINQSLLENWTPPTASAVPAGAQPVTSPAPISQRTYQFVSAPGDELSAGSIRTVLNRLGYRRVEAAGAYTILLVSYRTTRELIQSALAASAPILAILTTDIIVPRDLPELTNLQLVDFRTGNTEQLSAALSFLSDESEAARAQFSQNVMPVNLKPIGTNRVWVNLFTAIVTAMGASALYLLIRLLDLTGPSQATLALRDPFSESFNVTVGIVALGLINLVLGWCGLGMLRGVRRIHLNGIILLTTISIGLMGWLTITTASRPQREALAYFGSGFIGVHFLALTYVIFQLARQPHLLIPPTMQALGAPSARPRWGLIILILGAVFLLSVSGFLPVCVVPIIAIIVLILIIGLPGRLRRMAQTG